jgi:hypothetical protein
MNLLTLLQNKLPPCRGIIAAVLTILRQKSAGRGGKKFVYAGA